MFNYKGISKDKSYWKFGNSFIDLNNEMYIFENNIKSENYLNNEYIFAISKNYLNQILKETLCISFGKFDRNNKEIFTNDIAKVPAGYCGDNYYDSTESIVMFEDYEFFLWNKNDEYNVTWQYFEWNQLEITGNKFDYLIS